MPHWRTMTDREYLGAWDFPADRTAEIVRVTKREMAGTGRIKKNSKPVLEFKNTEKRLIAGVTICKTIEGMYGNDVANWIGKRITMYAATTKSEGGEIVDCVRVRPMIPKSKATGVESQPVDDAMRERQMRAAGEAPQPDAPVEVTTPREPGQEG